ncbi:MAG TPA: hypothetical protein VNL70_07560, partial [Tepidisphaeraceae bacterium]|nr:hypothetical protein [Tepidisphaeraceae bacterium]
KLVFGFMLTYVAGYTVFSAVNRQTVGRNVLLAGVVLMFCVGVFALAKWLNGAGTTPAPPVASAAVAQSPARS